MQRSVAVARAQAWYNEETGDSISTTFLQNAYDDVQREVAEETLCYPVSTTTNLTDSTRTLILPAGLFAIRRKGIFTTIYNPLPGPERMDDIIAADVNWKTTEGTVAKWYIDAELNTTSGVTNWAIGFAPVPSATVTNGITIQGFGIPADSTGDTYAPPWPTPYHDVMIWGMCVRACVRDFGMEMKNVKATTYFTGGYEKAKSRLKTFAAGGIATHRIIRGSRAEQGTDEGTGVIRLSMTIS